MDWGGLYNGIGSDHVHAQEIPPRIEEEISKEDVLRGEVLDLREDDVGWVRKACSLRP